MGSDYLLVIGILLVFSIQALPVGILCILAACFLKRRNHHSKRKNIDLNDMA